MTALELISNESKNATFPLSTSVKPAVKLRELEATTIAVSALATPPHSPYATVTGRLSSTQTPLMHGQVASEQTMSSKTDSDSQISPMNNQESCQTTETPIDTEQSSLVVEVVAEVVNQAESDQQVENIERLKSKIIANNERLQESLRNSYNRLRSIQTQSFQSHVAQQLTSILELKEKQKLVSSEPPVTSTNRSGNKSNKSGEQQVGDVMDDTSVDLLTSILKSNLSEPVEEKRVPSETVNAAVKSLLDDIQYEILRQDDEKSLKSKEEAADSATEDEQTDDESTDLAAADECSVAWKYCSQAAAPVPKQTGGVRANVDVASEQNKDAQIWDNTSQDQNKNLLTDSSNIFWSKKRIQLGSEWTRVQLKLKQLKVKAKQCNDHLDQRSTLENHQTVTKQQTQIKPVEATETKSDQAAIAALSTSLQESVAAEVFGLDEPSIQPSPDTQTASRCLPYTRTGTSKLFNLSRSDLIELDDEALKSFYYTLRYFSNTYFKTMCLCSDRSAGKKNTYYYQRKKRMQQKDGINECSAAEALCRTCIFCHLLKKYEQSRSDSASLVNKASRQMDGQSLKAKSPAEKKKTDAITKLNNSVPVKDFIATPGSSLADPNIVNRDHSYCKLPNPTKKSFLVANSDTTTEIFCGKKQKLLKTNTNEELLDKLVDARLSRIFDGQVIKEEKMDTPINERRNDVSEEATSIGPDGEQRQTDEEVIDAGFELSPDDVQNLPDLSYEELKFLNEIEIDKTTLRKKYKFSEDSIYENSGYSRDYTSFLANKAYPLPYQMSSDIFHALNYHPKYRNLLNKKRREQKRTDQLQLNEFNKMTDKLDQKKQRTRTTSTCDQTPTRSTKKSSRKSEKTNSPSSKAIAPAVRPRKRQRSTSSYSSNSSVFSCSNTDSNYADSVNNMSPLNPSTTKSNTSNFNYYNPNRYDIDNIIIPFDMAASSVKPPATFNKQTSVPTPKWCEKHVEAFISIADNELEETLDDAYFIQLHDLCEKRKLDVARSKKMKLGQNELNLSLPAAFFTKKSPSGSSEFEEEKKLNSSLNLTKHPVTRPTARQLTKSEWMPREFPLNDQEYEALFKQQETPGVENSREQIINK